MAQIEYSNAEFYVTVVFRSSVSVYIWRSFALTYNLNIYWPYLLVSQLSSHTFYLCQNLLNVILSGQRIYNQRFCGLIRYGFCILFFIRKCTMAQQLFLVNLLMLYYSSQLASALLVRENHGLNAVNFKIAVYNVRLSRFFKKHVYVP